MKEMSDGGGIYTLGSMPGTYLTENYSYDFARSTWAGDWPNAGFFIDDGSADLTLENNVVDNVPMGIWLGAGTVRNTVINFAGSIEPSSRDPAPTVINNGDINRDAIRANAGIEPAYADIISGGRVRGGDGVPVSTATSDFHYRPCHELRTDMSVSNDEYDRRCPRRDD